MEDMFAPFRVTIPPVDYFLKPINDDASLWVIRIVLVACLVGALAVCVHYTRADRRSKQEKKDKKEE